MRHRVHRPVPRHLRIACLVALALVATPAAAQDEGPTVAAGASGYEPADLSNVRFVAEGRDGKDHPFESMAYSPDYGKDVVVKGRVEGGRVGRIDLIQPSGWRGWTMPDSLSGEFSFRFRPRASGTYRLDAPGSPGASTSFHLTVRPIVIVNPALLVTQGGRKRVIPMREGRRIVVSGWARPKASTRSGRVQLQYQSEGRWVDLAAASGVGSGGQWRLSYRLTRAARVDAWLRVVYRATVGGTEAWSLPFVVPIR